MASVVEGAGFSLKPDQNTQLLQAIKQLAWGNTSARRAIVAGQGVTVSNGDGVTGNPTVALANSGAAAGTYGMVTVDAMGRVTAGRQMQPADVPGLDWSKITSGTPTTLAGYGISDAAAMRGRAPAGVGLDWNSLTLYGVYAVAVGSFDGSNHPRSVFPDAPTYGMLEVLPSLDSSGLLQRYTSTAADWVLQRSKWGTGEWSQWQRIGISTVVAPPGKVSHFAMTAPPAGWVKCDGALLSRAAYPALFAAIGTTFGAGDGKTTFGVPDLRGEFVRGWDDGRGVDSSRAFGSSQSGQNQSHEHGWGIWSSRTVEVPNGDFAPNGVLLKQVTGSAVEFDNYSYGDTTNLPGPANIVKGVTSGQGGNEARPRNVALLACIKI
ncbi:hypothetical protein CEK28_04910 [Xenophilus sp. AP218F]|nr:hypothetical protein CEK28_04910 [Xenophilus sp. AP218F]